MSTTIFNLMQNAINMGNNIIRLLISFALVGFLWGVVKVIFNNDDPKSKQEGRQYMLYGILSLFVMTSMWGLVYLFKSVMSIEVGLLPVAGEIANK